VRGSESTNDVEKEPRNVRRAIATEDLLREAAPRVLAAVVRRFGDFADSEDAVQEAMIDAARQWPAQGTPESPVGWLVHVASRRMTDRIRSDSARRGREDAVVADPTAGSVAEAAPEEPAGNDDTLVLMFMCCHPALSPPSAIALTLRAVAGLTTAEIASAFLVPEATMAQRISRAKQSIKASPEPFRMPEQDERAERLRSVRRVVYLTFNEGYVSSAGAELARAELAAEAIRLARIAHLALPEDPEVAGLLALMLLTDSRRAARSDAVGEYQLQAAIAAEHARAARPEDTDWREILGLYGLLERVTGNPMVTLNRAIAAAMVDGPEAGLTLLGDLDEPLGGHHRLHATRAHLLEMSGDTEAAIAEYRHAADRTNSLPERHYLTKQAARLNEGSPGAG
jgi:RNA polymerase sigma factor (sigma-70 family)